VGTLENIKLKDVLGKERRFDIRLAFPKNEKSIPKDEKLPASVGFNVILNLFQTIV